VYHVWLQYGKFKESKAKTDDHCRDLKHCIDLKNNQAAGPQAGSFSRFSFWKANAHQCNPGSRRTVCQKKIQPTYLTVRSKRTPLWVEIIFQKRSQAWKDALCSLSRVT
jgi:hypothetical protein